MLMEYTAQILRGWPADGSLDRQELIKQGSVLVNGDVVEMQADGTVDKVGATATNRVGLVIRGNGDMGVYAATGLGIGSGANSNGRFMTPQPAVTVSALSWATGVLTVTAAGHNLVVGNAVTIAAATTTAVNGNYTVASVTSTSIFTVVLVASPGAITVGPATMTQMSTYNNSGKAVVLWSNYIVQTTNYAAGAYVPGSKVTAKGGQFALATAASQLGSGTYAYTAEDPVVGHVLRVQGAGGIGSNAQTAHLVIAVK